jgi:phage/plasmid-associated DNA primase
MILCCNHLPSVPSDDGGTWRRIRVVEFTSRFCENPDPEKPTEFKMDTDLASHFDDWKEHFMSMLIEFYKDYKLNGIKEPEEVLKCTREYQRSNDCYLDFVESEMERSDFSFLSYNDVYTCFKNWMSDNAPSHMKGVQKNKAIKALDKILGKSIGVNKTGGWKGWVFKVINNNQDELDI